MYATSHVVTASLRVLFDGCVLVTSQAKAEITLMTSPGLFSFYQIFEENNILSQFVYFLTLLFCPAPMFSVCVCVHVCVCVQPAVQR